MLSFFILVVVTEFPQNGQDVQVPILIVWPLLIIGANLRHELRTKMTMGLGVALTNLWIVHISRYHTVEEYAPLIGIATGAYTITTTTTESL